MIQKDWHPADIKAALAKKNYTFSRIAREYGYRINSPSEVLRVPWSPMEAIVGDILGVHPSRIWPSRYDSSGHPLRSRGFLTVPKRLSQNNG
ncbi:MAG: helix-turn-helix domain-containing protein [Deltaproteobacteria bacterium]|nr:helix-turn-helix domain-containing protein [Deltaproteobacteria bacterium]